MPIALPRPAATAEATFDVCRTGIESAVAAAELVTLRPHVLAESASFEAAAASSSTHATPQTTAVDGVTDAKARMKALYKEKLVKGRGRRTYDEIKMLPKHRLCPLCGIGTVTTLDHYLPKEYFPLLAVTPLNLVPSCRDCNMGEKGTVFPTKAAEATFHPYFDDLGPDPWLDVTFNATRPIGILYAVKPPDSWTELQAQRFAHHFSEFSLAERFSTQAGIELAMRSKVFGDLVAEAEPAQSAAELRLHLLREAASARDENPTSWKTALYDALAASQWFLSTGYSWI